MIPTDPATARRAELFRLTDRANALRVQIGTWQRRQLRRGEDPEPRQAEAIAIIARAIAVADVDQLGAIVTIAAEWHHVNITYTWPRDEDALLDRILALA